MFRKKRNNFRRRQKSYSKSFNKSEKKPLKKILFLAIIISLVYFFLFSNTFKLQTIKFSDEALTSSSLIPKIQEDLKSYLGSHLFKLDIQEINQKLDENFPEIAEIEVSKSYPHSIKIDFKKYPLKANVINESNSVKKNYIINSAGQAVKEDFESPNLPYIYLITEEPVNPATPLIESSKIDYILKSTEDFNARFGMKILSVRYKPTAREVHLLTEKQFYIWLDIQQPYEDQFKKLKKALPKLDIYNQPLEYIDLRIAGNEGDRIIYKSK